jgi:hypothetical protein
MRACGLLVCALSNQDIVRQCGDFTCACARDPTRRHGAHLYLKFSAEGEAYSSHAKVRRRSGKRIARVAVISGMANRENMTIAQPPTREASADLADTSVLTKSQRHGRDGAPAGPLRLGTGVRDLRQRMSSGHADGCRVARRARRHRLSGVHPEQPRVPADTDPEKIASIALHLGLAAMPGDDEAGA